MKVSRKRQLCEELAKTIGFASLDDTKTVVGKDGLAKGLPFTKEVFAEILAHFKSLLGKKLRQRGVESPRDVIRVLRSMVRDKEIRQGVSLSRRNVRRGGKQVSLYSYQLLSH